MTPRLKHVELEGFRGFAERRVIDLDADAVVVRGDNGTGKTSLVDGMLWLFSGELAHLVERVRGLRRTEDAVTSRFNPYGARVKLGVEAEGAIHVFTRTGNERRTQLNVLIDGVELLEDAAAEAHLAEVFGTGRPAEFHQAVLTWGLLRQDAIRAALDKTGGALHQRLSGLIGLDRVSAFATAATRASDGLIRERTAARSTRAKVAERHEETVARLDVARRASGSPAETRRLLTEGFEAIQARLDSSVMLVVDDPVDLETITRVGSAASRIAESVATLQERQRTLARFPEDMQDLIADAENAAAAAAIAADESAERAPALVQLASSALDLLARIHRCGWLDEL